MEAIVERCAGLDVHQESVVACVLVGAANRQPRKEVQTFGTMTRDLMELRLWLLSQGCTHVGMESTGVYWKPVYAILEDHFQLIVGNAQHIKNVPGRKTDVKDAEWIAELVRHGLIRSSFVPPAPIRELRDLVRYRTTLTHVATAEKNRLLNVLETANIKLASVASDVFGVSGTAMMRALIDGKMSPYEMAGLAKGRLRKKSAELQEALEGTLNSHHRVLLDIQLRRLEQVEQDIAALDQQIEDRMAPYREQRERLTEIPGVGSVVAACIIAELGIDMGAFPTDRHVSAWAGVCPGSYESAGKRHKGPSRKGNQHLRTILVQAAQAGVRRKGCFLRDKYYKLAGRLGKKKALLAIAHKILVAAYHMLRTGQHYNELGETFLDALDKNRTLHRLKERIERLGFTVHLEEKAA